MTLPDVDRFVIAPPPAQTTEPPATQAPAAAMQTRPENAPAKVSVMAAPASSAPTSPTTRHRTELPTWALLTLLVVLVIGGWLWRRSRRLAQETARLARQHRALQSIHHRLRNESEQLRQQATNDPLTGALNRQAFAGGLREMLEHLSHYAKPVHLIVLDLDHFKAINDRLGHLAGDRALKLVTGVVHEHLDSADLFGRFGGDEFLIASADHDAASAHALAEAIRVAVEAEALRQTPSLEGLTLSMGLAQADPDSGYSADALFARADAALYEAKRQGRNRVVVANPQTPERLNAFAERHL